MYTNNSYIIITMPSCQCECSFRIIVGVKLYADKSRIAIHYINTTFDNCFIFSIVANDGSVLVDIKYALKYYTTLKIDS